MFINPSIQDSVTSLPPGEAAELLSLVGRAAAEAAADGDGEGAA